MPPLQEVLYLRLAACSTIQPAPFLRTLRTGQGNAFSAASFSPPTSQPGVLSVCVCVCVCVCLGVCVCVSLYMGKKFRRKMGSHQGEASMKGHCPFL